MAGGLTQIGRHSCVNRTEWHNRDIESFELARSKIRIHAAHKAPSQDFAVTDAAEKSVEKFANIQISNRLIKKDSQNH